MWGMMTKLKLTANEAKTRVAKLPEEKFDFLGYTFGRCYSPNTGLAYLGTVPAWKRVKRIRQAISGETRRSTTQMEAMVVVTKLNQMMNGWPITSVLVQSVKPMLRWNVMLAEGCVGGCVPSIKLHGRRPRSFRMPAFMTTLAGPAYTANKESSSAVLWAY